MERSAGDKRQSGFIIFYCKNESFYLLWRNAGIAVFQYGRNVIRYEVEHEFEGAGGPASLNQRIADRPELFPFGKFIRPYFFVFPFFCRIKRLVLASVYQKRVIGADGGLFHKKRVERFGRQKFSHKVFDIFNLVRNHCYSHLSVFTDVHTFLLF